MSKFFTTKDNFKKIIEDILGSIDKMEQISTGWTNFVYKVESNGQRYVFRFPRNNFFSDDIYKEVEFNKFIKGKLSFATTDLKLMFNKNRPFTMHKEIEGESMANLYSELTNKDKENIANEICDFIDELQHVDLTDLKIDLETTSSFLTNLSKVDDQDYDLTKLDPLKELEKKQLVLSHADLNPGNILLDKNHHVCAILDFAFVSLTHPLNDMARLIGRLPKDYYPIMVNAYNNKYNVTLPNKIIDDIIGVWNHVEYHYMIYMRNNHPEIKF